MRAVVVIFQRIAQRISSGGKRTGADNRRRIDGETRISRINGDAAVIDAFGKNHAGGGERPAEKREIGRGEGRVDADHAGEVAAQAFLTENRPGLVFDKARRDQDDS